jgi:hypothetical protein
LRVSVTLEPDETWKERKKEKERKRENQDMAFA